MTLKGLPQRKSLINSTGLKSKMSQNQKTINRKSTGKENAFSTNVTYTGHRIFKGF